MRRGAWHGLVLLALGAAAGAADAAPAAPAGAGASRGQADSRTFLEHGLAVLRLYAQQATSYVADVTLAQRVPGLTQTIKSDCRITLTPPRVVTKDVRNPYPYVVIVSNNVVTTVFPATQERDQRLLLAGEAPLDFMLGVPDLAVLRDYNLAVRIEEDLYVVTVVARPAQRAAFAADLLANAHRVVRCTIWIQPHLRRVVRTERVTLAGEETTYEIRAQWLNTTPQQ
jgi:hypothetical protein